MSQLTSAQRTAAGFHADPALANPFSATQAAWRFYNNERIDLPQLAGPLIRCGQEAVQEACDYALMVLDWSPLHYGHHDSKSDRIELAHEKDLGYKLLTALLVSDRDGSPLAPMCLELEAEEGVYSTREEQPFPALSSLDNLAPVMEHMEQLRLSKPLVFIIDREADSVGHYRQWQRQGRHWVIRADDQRLVMHEGKERQLVTVAMKLKKKGKTLKGVREVEYQGRPAWQYVGETQVVLHRPARTHRVNKRTGKAKHVNIAGPPVSMRLVVSEIRDEKGKVLARWLLLSNLPESVSGGTVALWYYWRWRIESYHKLLKGAGQHIECWQQETAGALARRLTVAAMACVVVWKLARDGRAEALEMKEVLVRLSGRQMKRGKRARGFTEPALLAGLGVLIPMLLLLERYSVEELRRLASAVLPQLLPQPSRQERT